MKASRKGRKALSTRKPFSLEKESTKNLKRALQTVDFDVSILYFSFFLFSKKEFFVSSNRNCDKHSTAS